MTKIKPQNRVPAKHWGNRMAKCAMAAAAENCGREYGRQKNGRHTPMVGQRAYRPRSISPRGPCRENCDLGVGKNGEGQEERTLQLNRANRVRFNSTHAHQR